MSDDFSSPVGSLRATPRSRGRVRHAPRKYVLLMTRFGTNLRLNLDISHRDAVRGFFEQGLGCSRRAPKDTIDLFALEDGGMVGVFYVTSDKALAREAYDIAPWLEFRVKNPVETARSLLGYGAERVENPDSEHPYLRIPGGPIFRLAPL